MFRFVAIIFFLLFVFQNTYSQNEEYQKTIFKPCPVNDTITINFRTNNYDLNTLGQLKDDLWMFEDKVIHVAVLEQEKIFTLSYNSKMSLNDLKLTFSKYEVDFLKSNETIFQHQQK